jgi:hypothetical protein
MKSTSISSCAPREAEPHIPAEFFSAIAPLGADIETDFAISETAS